MHAWYEHPLLVQEENLEMLQYHDNIERMPPLLKKMVCYAVASSLPEAQQVNYIAELHAITEGEGGLWYVDVTDESAHLSSYADSPGRRFGKALTEYKQRDGFNALLSLITKDTTALPVIEGRTTKWLGDIVIITVGEVERTPS